MHDSSNSKRIWPARRLANEREAEREASWRTCLGASRLRADFNLAWNVRSRIFGDCSPCSETTRKSVMTEKQSRTTIERSRIVNGIEFFRIVSHDGETANVIDDCQCARCGSSCTFVDCDNCGGEGTIEDDDWQADEGDCHPCDWCHGSGGWWRCLSSRAWCLAHPRQGREEQPSTATESE